jgi:hypothetical protein
VESDDRDSRNLTCDGILSSYGLTHASADRSGRKSGQKTSVAASRQSALPFVGRLALDDRPKVTAFDTFHGLSIVFVGAVGRRPCLLLIATPAYAVLQVDHAGSHMSTHDGNVGQYDEVGAEGAG